MLLKSIKGQLTVAEYWIPLCSKSMTFGKLQLPHFKSLSIPNIFSYQTPNKWCPPRPGRTTRWRGMPRRLVELTLWWSTQNFSGFLTFSSITGAHSEEFFVCDENYKLLLSELTTSFDKFNDILSYFMRLLYCWLPITSTRKHCRVHGFLYFICWI